METGDIYNIVIVGAMNPRIHHPLWYHLFNLIKDQELDEAIAAQNSRPANQMPPLVVLSDIAQFAFGKLTISCQPNRWEIKSSSFLDSGRMIQITCAVFDELLKHTPVNAFGFDYIGARLTEHGNVGELLASSVLRMPIELIRDGANSAEFTIRRVAEGRKITTTIRPSTNPMEFAFVINFEYIIDSNQTFKLFNLKETIEKRYYEDIKEGENQIGMVSKSISSSIGC